MNVLYKHTEELRKALDERNIPWERKGNDTTRFAHKGHVFIATVYEPSGEVILTTYPHTIADVLKEVSA